MRILSLTKKGTSFCVCHFQDMFGEESVPRTLTGDKLEVIVDGKTATIDLSSLGVTCRYAVAHLLFQNFEKKIFYSCFIFVRNSFSCSQDDVFQQMVTTAVLKLHHSLVPAEPNKLWKYMHRWLSRTLSKQIIICKKLWKMEKNKDSFLKGSQWRT